MKSRVRKRPKATTAARRITSLNAPIVFPGCQLRKIREESGITQPEMAKKIHMSASSLWKIEQGTDVKLSFARKIAKAYGQPLSILWPEEAAKND